MLETNHVSLSAVATGTGSVAKLNGEHEHLRVYARWASGVSAGEVTIEEADDPDYAGTWAEVGVLSFVDDGISTLATAAGAMLNVRARITTTVSGGGSPTVTVRIVASSGAGA